MKNDATTISSEKEITLAYLYGRQYERIKADIERFAESIDTFGPEVTRGMGALLSGAKEIWEILRPSDSVFMRRDPTKGSKKKRRRMEVDNRSRKKSLNGVTWVTDATKKRRSKKGKHPYWSKLTPEQRSKEMARRMAVRKKKAA